MEIKLYWLLLLLLLWKWQVMTPDKKKKKTKKLDRKASSFYFNRGLEKIKTFNFLSWIYLNHHKTVDSISYNKKTPKNARVHSQHECLTKKVCGSLWMKGHSLVLLCWKKKKKGTPINNDKRKGNQYRHVFRLKTIRKKIVFRLCKMFE